MGRLIAILAAAATVMTTSAFAQLTPESTPIRPEKIRDGLYVFFGAGGNIAVSIGEDGVFIVDDQFKEMTAKIEAAVKELTPKPIKYVINTHWHYDHTGGNENLGASGKIIIAQENTRKRLIMGGNVMGTQIAPTTAVGLPVITFAETSTLHMNGQTVQMTHLPRAHTDTDAAIFFKEANVLHTGDVYTHPTYPFVDPDSGGTLHGVIAGRKKILTICNATCVIIPGHGPLANAADVKKSIAMLEEMDKRVAKAVAAKTSLADFLATNPTADFDPTYAPRPDQGKVFVTRAYEERVTASEKK